MTQPRMVQPGDVVFMSARTVQRTFLFRPDKEFTDAAKYLLAHYSAVHGVELLAACLMSTHVHLVYRDTRGHGPCFLRDLNRGLASVTQVLRGWRGGVFAHRPSQVRLLTEQAVIDKIAYTLANPVEAGCVVRGALWPGVWSGRSLEEDHTETVARPSVYYNPDGGMPRQAVLRFHLPTHSASPGEASRVRQELQAAMTAKELESRNRVLKQRRKFLGRTGCLRVSPFARSKSREALRGLNPQFAVIGGTKSVYVQAVAELRAFLVAYRLALTNFRAGIMSTVFPCGTFMMRVAFGRPCAAPP